MMRTVIFSLLASIGLLNANPAAAAVSATETTPDSWCSGAVGPGRIVCADVVALDQVLVYNRFGSFNPFGMIFALRRDVAPIDPSNTAALTAAQCAAMTGTEAGNDGGELRPGAVRLKDCKRPRPLTLRANVGDRRVVRVSNLLQQPSPDFSGDLCGETGQDDAYRAEVRDSVSEGDQARVRHGERNCQTAASPDQAGADGNWPATRRVNFVAQGLHPVSIDGKPVHGACLGTDAIGPGEAPIICAYDIPREGPYFLASLAAPAGGEGDGGSLVHGLFGAILGERAGSRWYRSQVTQETFDLVWPKAADGSPLHSRSGIIDYEKTDVGGIPYLNMLRPLDGSQESVLGASRAELVHSDLNAVVYCGGAADADCRADTVGRIEQIPGEKPALAFREFSVFFHDELKTFYTRNFQELGALGQLAGVRDGFAINYGASGMGALLLANRKGIGPSAECMECLYEEFFLTSWANGDPALLERFADDPSNVHHSYLNDPVVFRNFHAGPKETHVFHLHAHQWFGGNDPNRGSYLDSQTVAPQQGFTYNIYHGGLRDPDGTGDGWWSRQGSGNRNRTIGDSIFHCHLYPHFAQGMWELWRVHDVLEDGTRKLPDGQAHEGLSVDFADKSPDFLRGKRPGSVDPVTGGWIAQARGTPVPAIVPLPGEPLPLLPSYANDPKWGDEAGTTVADGSAPMPGYPFYIAGETGHRPPQAPLDIARAMQGANGLLAPVGDIDDRSLSDSTWLTGALPRHTVLAGTRRAPSFALPATDPASLSDEARARLLTQIVAKAFALGDLTEKLVTANIRILDNAGTRLERAAMGFHHDGRVFDPDLASGDPGEGLRLIRSDGTDSVFDRGLYDSLRAPVPRDEPAAGAAPPPGAAGFPVNASPPRPGAPFADPCGVSPRANTPLAAGDPLYPDGSAYTRDPYLTGFRRYEVSAVQLDLIVNDAGWHDPQARINVLTARSDRYKIKPWDSTSISPVTSDREEPFFFRALSGECIEFRHTNESPKDLELDDFQVKTPTDTIGQHIHLVKFDVTSSDGSGNGWNYEDGTFAADELAARLCAWQDGGSIEARQMAAALAAKIWAAVAELPNEDRFGFKQDTAFCDWKVVKDHRIWRLPRSKFPFLFQTTAQRWFADPVLSPQGDGKLRDRTLRTVFTHDHFGPSSIQQHGFYAALVVEPEAEFADDGTPRHALTKVCAENGENCYVPLNTTNQLSKVAFGTETLTGTRKIVQVDPAAYALYGDFREYALSIADFALLYDPRDRISAAEFLASANSAGGEAGMSRLYCEARWRQSPALLAKYCGSAIFADGRDWSAAANDVPPAWLAAGRMGDRAHAADYGDDFFVQWPLSLSEIVALRHHAIDYRQKAAGLYGRSAPNAPSLASPVAPPARPEAITVDHHDPYLVNYRAEPIPVRIGNKEPADQHSNSCRPFELGRPGDYTADPSPAVSTLEKGTAPLCSYAYQLRGDKGDMGFALSSFIHGDPATPKLEAYQNERLMIRLIQGAQEVQHGFRLVGQPFKRNPDQPFSRGMSPRGESVDFASHPTRHAICADRLQHGRPEQYRKWLDEGVGGFNDPADQKFWTGYENLLAECDNAEGFTFAQEIGISEHFEFQGSLRADAGASIEKRPAPDASAASTPPVATATAATEVPEGVADSLYDFGSIDSFWNGAWGLVRIYRDANTKDPATNQPIGHRLATLRGSRQESATAAEQAPGAAASSGLTCPYDPQSAQNHLNEAVIVALQTADLWPGGTEYRGPRHDPDGLMLALLPPEAWPEGGLFASNDSWDALKRATLIHAIRDSYESAGPEPFVMRVNAGDCVALRFISLLTEQAGGGLRDLLGDARATPITPLNLDPAYRPVDGEAAGLHREMRMDRPKRGAPNGGMRPSARLALRIGLPGMDLVKDLPMGVGFMEPSMAPAARDGIVVSKPFQFYAGRYRVNLGDGQDMQRFREEIAAATFDPTNMRLGRSDGGPASAFHITLTDVPELAEATADEGDGLLTVLGQSYVLEVFVTDNQGAGEPLRLGSSAMANGTPALKHIVCTSATAPANCDADFDVFMADLAASADTAAKRALNARTHWIPYAFGAVPVTSLADPVSHVPHGMFGTIDVLPRDWRLGSPSHEAVPAAAGDWMPRRTVRHVPAGDGLPLAFTVAAAPSAVLPGQGETEAMPASPTPGPTRIREFVLFFQDGLAIRDRDAVTRWRWADNGVRIRDPLPGNPLIHPAADCHVCDDSYDLGETAVNYVSVPFSQMLRDQTETQLEDHDDLNLQQFPADFFPAASDATRLQACAGEQVLIRVLHPGGRARQRAFVMNSYGYEDLFPGFGFTNSALLTPGKSISAWLTPVLTEGTAIWHDGPLTRRAGGAWGLIEVTGKGKKMPGGDTLCPS